MTNSLSPQLLHGLWDPHPQTSLFSFECCVSACESPLNSSVEHNSNWSVWSMPPWWAHWYIFTNKLISLLAALTPLPHICSPINQKDRNWMLSEYSPSITHMLYFWSWFTAKFTSSPINKNAGPTWQETCVKANDLRFEWSFWVQCFPLAWALRNKKLYVQPLFEIT